MTSRIRQQDSHNVCFMADSCQTYNDHKEINS